jgi:hypothetical protein
MIKTYDNNDDVIMQDNNDLDGSLDDYHQLSVYRQRLIKAQIQDIEVNNYYNIDDNNRDGNGNGDKDADDSDKINGIHLDNNYHISDACILNENNDLNNYNEDNNLLLYKIEQVLY